MQELLVMLTALSNSVSGFDAQIAAMKSAVETKIAEEANKPQENNGNGNGQQPETPVSDKIYSQADLDAAVEAAVLPLQAEIGSLAAKISDLQAGVAQQVSQAVEGLKAELHAEMTAAQKDDQAIIAKLAPAVTPVVEPSTEVQA